MPLKIVMSYYQLVLIVLLSSVHVCETKAQSCDSLAGHWINQDSSIMHFDIETNGMLNGYYQSNASNDSLLFPLLGWVNRTMEPTPLTFAVSWGDYGSITSWTGYCQEEDDVSIITVMWHLVRPYVEHEWERILTNKSTFRPVDE